jgi:hypothetical protein
MSPLFSKWCRRVVIGVLIIGVTVVWGWYHFHRWEGCATNVDQLRGRMGVGRLVSILPSAAANIRYSCKSKDAITDAEFDLDELQFLAWAQEQGWDLVLIDENTICRSVRTLDDEWVGIKEGWHYVRFLGNGGSESAYYDRIAKRAYYSYWL